MSMASCNKEVGLRTRRGRRICHSDAEGFLLFPWKHGALCGSRALRARNHEPSAGWLPSLLDILKQENALPPSPLSLPLKIY